jgi:hypothetical protein
MAERPWVTPQEVIDYTESEEVKARSEARLSVDITRAEQYVITYCHNEFSDMDNVPQAVKTAVLILAEAYAHNAVVSTKELKSETFDDYGYTTEASSVSIEDLDLAALLDSYVIVCENNAVILRMRKL